jgi:hypothetical protein
MPRLSRPHCYPIPDPYGPTRILACDTTNSLRWKLNLRQPSSPSWRVPHARQRTLVVPINPQLHFESCFSFAETGYVTLSTYRDYFSSMGSLLMGGNQVCQRQVCQRIWCGVVWCGLTSWKHFLQAPDTWYILVVFFTAYNNTRLCFMSYWALCVSTFLVWTWEE